MDTNSLPITKEQITQLSNKAYETARAQGFYSGKTDISTAMMLIITEMAEAVQEDRKDGKVEPEVADIAIRILSLLGWYDSKKPVSFQVNAIIGCRCSIYRLGFKKRNSNLPRGLYYIICTSFASHYADSPDWIVTEALQDTLFKVFALSEHLGIDLLEHIRQKMEYNESREYKHGCKY